MRDAARFGLFSSTLTLRFAEPSRRRRRKLVVFLGSCLACAAVGHKLTSAPPSVPTRSVPSDQAPKGRAGVAQSVEHLFCKQAVRGSSPLASSKVGRITAERRVRFLSVVSEGCPSGQREQTVNLPAMPSLVRIQHPPLLIDTVPLLFFVFFFLFSLARGPRNARGSSSVGRASAFQAERRRFEPGLPLRRLLRSLT